MCDKFQSLFYWILGFSQAKDMRMGLIVNKFQSLFYWILGFSTPNTVVSIGALTVVSILILLDFGF